MKLSEGPSRVLKTLKDDMHHKALSERKAGCRNANANGGQLMTDADNSYRLHARSFARQRRALPQRHDSTRPPLISMREILENLPDGSEQVHALHGGFF